jgi:plasmid maintenance system killer protein
MKIEYKSNKVKKQLATATDIKKYFGVIAKRLSSRLDDIQSSTTLAILQQIKAADCHALSGNRRGQWSVVVSGNYRLIFEIDHDPIPENVNGSVDAKLITDIKIIEIVDYH